MHIGFLTSEFPNPKLSRSGGIGTSILNLAKGLVALGHRVSVIVYGQSGDGKFEQEGISVHTIRNPKVKGISRYLTQRKIEKLLNKLVAREALDLVEASDWTGITSGIKPECPVVVRLHGSDTYFCHLDQRPVKPINRKREKKALENADAVVSVSAYTAQVTKELFGLGRPISIIPNGLDVDNFEPSETVPEVGKVLYFGTLIRKKGMLELPSIFNALVEQNPNVSLELVGKDSADVLTKKPSTWELMQPLFSDKALPKVTYSGAVRYSEMRRKIDEAEVCVFPTFAEALPVSWIEAMAMEKAIVASNIGWADEVLENRSQGFLVHPTAHVEFAGKINDLLLDPELRKTIGKQARKRVIDHFASEVVAKKNEAFYLGLIR
ncbi:glycosyltransferase family 4 protein [Flavobacterium selenitireducens]|uniref:glycosyltransferase family 4 protein n=1 Tax=Flavobacterium selenitireducens TaxID=2722704 RepID=UPI00168A5627|nr:glycosyltransferase family 4 protein [Flavobacterium selenitireducens]MBD3583431.1 glycosyltransferase family 4 protein [Flavobacterium selenitireducens]